MRNTLGERGFSGEGEKGEWDKWIRDNGGKWVLPLSFPLYPLSAFFENGLTTAMFLSYHWIEHIRSMSLI